MKTNTKKLLLVLALLGVPLIYFFMETITNKLRALVGLATWQSIALPILKRLEGFSAKPYKDHKQWSIGYGSNAGALSAQPTISYITREDAEIKLKFLMEQYYNTYVRAKVKVKLNEKQKAALAIYAYNIPAGAVDIIQEINRGADRATIRREWLEWNKASGVTNASLVKRRLEEYNLFIS